MTKTDILMTAVWAEIFNLCGWAPYGFFVQFSVALLVGMIIAFLWEKRNDY